jgi:hypothetical protein
MDWKEGIPQFPLDKENKLKEEVLGAFLQMWFFLGKGGEGLWVLIDGGKRERGLDVWGISKE